jgi:hypothetical protein
VRRRSPRLATSDGSGLAPTRLRRTMRPGPGPARLAKTAGQAHRTPLLESRSWPNISGRFLMTRVREEAKLFGTRRGALTGLGATG